MKEKVNTTCQVCGRAIKASKDLIAHHGYQRPWQQGYQTGSCRGARYAPYEVSCDRLREVAEEVRNFITSTEKALTEFLETPPSVIKVLEDRSSWHPGSGKWVPYEKPEDFMKDSYRSRIPRTYEYAYSNREDDYKRDIRMAKADLASMERRLAEWKPLVVASQM